MPVVFGHVPPQCPARGRPSDPVDELSFRPFRQAARLLATRQQRLEPRPLVVAQIRSPGRRYAGLRYSGSSSSAESSTGDLTSPGHPRPHADNTSSSTRTTYDKRAGHHVHLLVSTRRTGHSASWSGRASTRTPRAWTGSWMPVVDASALDRPSLCPLTLDVPVCMFLHTFVVLAALHDWLFQAPREPPPGPTMRPSSCTRSGWRRPVRTSTRPSQRRLGLCDRRHARTLPGGD